VPPAERLRAAVAGYPVEVLSDAIAAVLHTELVGARLVAVWAIEDVGNVERHHSPTRRWTPSWRGSGGECGSIAAPARVAALLPAALLLHSCLDSPPLQA